MNIGLKTVEPPTCWVGRVSLANPETWAGKFLQIDKTWVKIVIAHNLIGESFIPNNFIFLEWTVEKPQKFFLVSETGSDVDEQEQLDTVVSGT